ncbi:ATP-dependent DNA ligase [Tersicoccus sp. Bi-70]|uniref:ATP-dependent DNA ligase n=1 Tax=Tersicoccus sp. Bi-70 TaxID=1897634 RepID=UPI0009762A44|nr:ATP-dependent DNA ligase [Tersicoccus sp. Bi-70]OMH31538.1 ATP-dependent DNA ligase [Tersicoccus sp. Bi-70]
MTALTAENPVAPMLAKAVATVPAPDSVPGGLQYEPKWDGFRAIIYADGTDVQIGSRGSKMLTRYFPEVVAQIAEQVTVPCVLDGELIVRTGEPGSERLDWEALSQRIHPAASRVNRLAEETPASFVAFDLLAENGQSLLEEPLAERRSRLEKLMAPLRAPLHLSQTTDDLATAQRWLEEFEGAGLDGVVAKPLSSAYLPNKRTMLKIKYHRTADVVALGYRIHKSGQGVGSILVGLYQGDELYGVGGVSAFSDARRLELIDELDPVVERDEHGAAVTGEGERNRFSSNKDTSFVRLRPERVLEVQYDQMEGMRFRHTAQFARWRPDREARSCTYDQLDVPVAWDLNDVLL